MKSATAVQNNGEILEPKFYGKGFMNVSTSQQTTKVIESLSTPHPQSIPPSMHTVKAWFRCKWVMHVGCVVMRMPMRTRSVRWEYIPAIQRDTHRAQMRTQSGKRIRDRDAPPDDDHPSTRPSFSLNLPRIRTPLFFSSTVPFELLNGGSVCSQVSPCCGCFSFLVFRDRNL